MVEGTFIVQRDDALIAQWKAVSDEYAPRIQTRQKTESDVLAYVKATYPTAELKSAEIEEVVTHNALAHSDFLPDGVFADGADVAVIKVLNEGNGKVLYESQQSEYKALIAQIRETLPDIEDITEFPIPIFVGVEKHSGFVYTEGSPTLSEKILMLQGLNEKERSNVYLVANYVRILKKYGRMDLLDL